ncbi:MAG: HDOD domain-containing protein [Opitutaceae bacterium]
MIATETPKPASSVEALVAAQRQIPPAAHVLANLQRLLADPNSDLEDIAKLIQLDAALAARVVHVSNSAWFGRTASCETILDAVRQIGFREMYHIVAVVGSAAIMSQPVLTYRRDAMAAWRESVSCAIAAELLAERCGEDGMAAYLAGLLHAVGRLAINQHIAGGGAAGIRELRDEGFPLDFSGAEFALFGFSQADVAAAMLRQWKFSVSVSEPIRLQYDPLEIQEPMDRIGAALYGGRLLRSVLCGKLDVPAVPGEGEIFGLLRMTRDDVLAFLPELQQRMSHAQRITKA